ncbi:hypothetical protein HN592_02195 [Candidatus Woesearchaeota archaeon]|jgi:uncharacterized Fe-S cluster-containing MiaB family protein|nr:hypothetical protein [Candidatus Woesearchaeota archaeon]MBT4368023.1 hypothetical protein [Candidatus Woesearchaeota archaeon]MBT4712511.1 hypothetical protein [Candidatus Woesearchaeota archaeon]MBT6639424.1 hypothetical protein [Candidatus Woesearchaeota archaeon]MBT7133596.1 hypothetical protein [Candidatus Woesearchaeota archaeon]
MFIEDVIKKIWEPVSANSKQNQDRLTALSTEELVAEATETCLMGGYQYEHGSLSLLPSLGCVHRNNEGEFAGCSICDYHSEFTAGAAAMMVLRERDVDLYGKVMKRSFTNARGEQPDPLRPKELISNYNMFCPTETPEETFLELFETPILSKPPKLGYVFEVRATDVTEDRLRLLRRCFGDTKFTLEFGAETSDEFVLNHWLNKDLTREQIVKSVELMRRYDVKASPDVIIGMPGLTEEQSIQQFVDTITWFSPLGTNFTVLPLNRKQYTLQGYLHEHLRADPLLERAGLAQGEHTGIPWLYTIVEALDRVFRLDPNLERRMSISQVYPNTNSIGNVVPYNTEFDDPESQEIRASLNRYFVSEEGIEGIGYANNIHAIRERMTQFPDYQNYLALLEKQKRAGSVRSTLCLLSEQIAKQMWPENWHPRYVEFNEELATYNPPQNTQA